MQTLRRAAAVLICPAVAWLGAACERGGERTPTAPLSVRGPQAELTAVQALMQQLLASEPLIPDGTLSPDAPLPVGHTIHVVTHDNQDSWKVQVASGTVRMLTVCPPSR